MEKIQLFMVKIISDWIIKEAGEGLFISQVQETKYAYLWITFSLHVFLNIIDYLRESLSLSIT